MKIFYTSILSMLVLTASAQAFKFISPGQGGTIKKGSTASIKWEGGSPGQIVILEVYRGGNQIGASMETTNTGQYNWNVPKDLEKAADYHLQISDGRQTADSELFSVKSKTPWLLILTPVVAGAVLIPILGGSGSKTESTALPAAPNPN